MFPGVSVHRNVSLRRKASINLHLHFINQSFSSSAMLRHHLRGVNLGGSSFRTSKHRNHFIEKMKINHISAHHHENDWLPLSKAHRKSAPISSWPGGQKHGIIEIFHAGPINNQRHIGAEIMKRKWNGESISMAKMAASSSASLKSLK